MLLLELLILISYVEIYIYIKKIELKINNMRKTLIDF